MYDLFSKRNRKPDQNPGVYTYDWVPQELRVQVLHSCTRVFDGIQEEPSSVRKRVYAIARNVLCEELGITQLSKNPKDSSSDLWDYFLANDNALECLDVIEAVFFSFVSGFNKNAFNHCGLESFVQRAVSEINKRFQQHKIGYELIGGNVPESVEIPQKNGYPLITVPEMTPVQFFRIDSNILHTEAVMPVIKLLREQYLAGANEEFLSALQHFRYQRYAEGITDCNKAFESAMKCICEKRKWPYEQGFTASKMIEACRKNGLFPPYVESSLSGLYAVLQGISTLRSKQTAHGKGVQKIEIDQDTAQFVLHSTAANILYLANLEKKMSQSI